MVIGRGHDGSQVFVSCLFPRCVFRASQQPSEMAKGIGNMKVVISASRVSKVWVLVLGVMCVCGFVRSAQAQSITWQFLPFPQNSDWPGPQGTQAVTNGTQVTLQGWPVVTAQS